MDLNQIIQKIPRPVLVIGILIVAIVLIVYNDPLRDECEVQTSIFEKKTQGLISPVRKYGKTQYPQINYWKDRCKEGNSIGACNDYFEGLRSLTRELKQVSETCQIKYITNNESLSNQITQALQIMALVAWGEKPPVGISERIGWLNETHVRTFCYLKQTLLLTGGDESYLYIRSKVYREFPGDWPDKFDVNKLVASNTDKSNPKNDVDVSKLMAENRPRALKSVSNASGTMTESEIYERSIFSIRCDMYM